MQLGLIVDLGKKRSIKQLDLQTSTPGFSVELYAADTAQAPPDILDTRWAHLHNGDGVAKAGLGSPGERQPQVPLGADVVHRAAEEARRP